jgi:hypothetical protein
LPRTPVQVILILAAFALPGVVHNPAAAAGAVPLVGYRAVEDLSLDTDKNSPSIVGVTGRLVTEFTGSACVGYTTSTRMVVQAVDSDGSHKVNDARTVTFESPDGRLDFDNQSFTDGKLDEASKGSAQRTGEIITVTLTVPGKQAATFDASLVFPTEQIARVIAAARAGTRFLAFTAYDGLDDGLSPAPTSTVIGAESSDPADVGDETAIADAGFAGLRHWPVTISYFDKDASADQPPDYTMHATLYENGVMGQLRLDFVNFSLVGKLVELDKLPAKPCP